MKFRLQYHMGRYYVMSEEDYGDYPFSSKKWEKYTPYAPAGFQYEFPKFEPDFKQILKEGAPTETLGLRLFDEVIKFEMAKRDFKSIIVLKEVEI